MPEDPIAPLVADFARYRADEAIRLADYDTTDSDDVSREEARSELASLVARIAELQARLYAEEARAVLVVLQGIDAAGKDSTVKHVFRGSNPRACACPRSRSRRPKRSRTTSCGATTPSARATG